MGRRPARDVPGSAVNLRIFFLALGMVAAGMNSLLIAGLLPEIAATLETTEAAVGLSASALALTYALTGPFIPIVFSRFSRRAIMMAAMSIFLVGVLLSAFAWDIWSFYAARAIVGLGTAAFSAQAMAAAMEIAPPDRKGAAVTWVAMGFAVSMALGVPAGTLLGEAFGYRIAFLVTAAIGAIALAGFPIVRISVSPKRPTLREQFRPLVQPEVVSVLVLMVFYASSFYMVLTYLFPILVEAAGADATMVAVALTVFGLCNIASMAIGGRLIDRVGGLAVVVTCLLVMGIATPLLGLQIGFLGAVIAIAAFGLTGCLVGPSTNVVLGELHPQNPATVVGAGMSAVQLGGVVAGALGAALLAGPGASWVAFVAGPFALLAALVSGGLLLVRRARRAAAALPAEVAA